MKKSLPLILSAALLFSLAYAQTESLVIVKATYGAGSVQRDVTRVIQDHIRGSTLAIRVANSEFGGDPIFGQTKILYVRYRTSANDFEVTAKEGETLHLPSPNAHASAPTSEGEQLSETSRSTKAAETSLVPLPTPRRRLAPDGIFYLTQRISVTTDDGILGFPPGTEVRRVSQSPNGITVRTRSGTQTVVQDYQITNDLDTAARIANADASAQQTAAQVREREGAAQAAREVAAAKQQQEATAAATAEAKRKKAEAAEQYVPPPSTRMQRIGGG